MFRNGVFRCQCGTCKPLPPYANEDVYVRIRCPSCSKAIFQCRYCPSSAQTKYNIERHIRNYHSTATATFSIADTDVHSGENAASDDYDDVTGRPFFDGSVANNDDQCDQSVSDDEEDEQDEIFASLLDDDEDDEGSLCPDEYLFDYQALRNHNPNTRPISEFTFENCNKSRVYYWQDYMHWKTTGKQFGGIKGVAWRSINQVQSYNEENMLKIEDAKLMFNFMDHALNNSGKQQQIFYDIVAEIIQRLGKSNSALGEFIESLDDYQRGAFDSLISSMDQSQRERFEHLQSRPTLDIKAPTNCTEANEMLLKGRRSIYSNIPSAAVEIIADHAVVSLDALFDHIMAQGIPILWKQDRNGVVNSEKINGSPAAVALHDEFLLDMDDPNSSALGLFLGWSDGFTRVYVKKKKNSVWIMTMAILDPGGNSTSIFHTYCIAIGNSSSDHTPVLEYFLKQLDTVRKEKVRYCGASCDFVKTSFRMQGYSSDRVERCELLKTLSGGTYGPRSHFAFQIDPDAFPFCDRCFNLVIASLHQSEYPLFPDGEESCDDCCRWDCSSNSPASKTNPLPEKYPSRASTTSPVPPANRTVNETCVVPMRQQFSWLKQGLEFAHHNLTTNERTFDNQKIRWGKAEMAAYLRTMAINESVQEAVWKSARAKLNHPLSATIPYIPALWETCILMERFLNSPMHLLFHGLVKNVMELLHKFMIKLGRLATFERFVNRYLSEIESYRLDWLKLRELPCTNWLAEDLLGMSRIMPFVYGMFFLNYPVPPIYSEAGRSLQQTLNSLHVLTSSLMSTRCTFSDSRKVDMYIKIFLSSVHRSAKLVLGKREGDTWLTNKANPVSLLNLTEQLENYGPLRWYWEGVCERYIQIVKPYLIKNMRRTPTYFKKKMSLLHKMVFIKRLSSLLNGRDQSEPEQLSHSKGYYRYSSLQDLKEKFDQGRCLSCFKLNVGPPDLVWIAFGRAHQVMGIIPASISNLEGEESCGFTYFQFELQENKQIQQKRTNLEQHISCHGFLFPLVTPPMDQFNHMFGAVFSDWDVLKKNVSKGESLLSLRLYEVVD